MNLFQYFDKDRLDQSYCVIGDTIANSTELAKHLRAELDETFHIQKLSYSRMTITDARMLREQGTQAKKVIFILQIAFAFRETQNALLKTLEEPGQGITFILCVPQTETLLDTILSRCTLIDTRTETEEAEPDTKNLYPINPEEFMGMSPEKRLEVIKATTKDSDSWTYGEVQGFLNALEKLLHTKYFTNADAAHNREEVAEIFTSLEKAKEYLGSPSASIPMILEMVGLIL